jgi:general secretion pathway protein C
VSAFVIWAVVALSATFWAMRLLVRSQPAPAHAAPAAESMAARGDLSRLFGSAAVGSPVAVAAPATTSRFRLVGVAAPRPGSVAGSGIALIAIDGKPPRPFRVGAAVEGDLRLRAIDLRTASLGSRDGAATVILEIPPRPVAATGSLPPAPSFSASPSPSAGVPETAGVAAPQSTPSPPSSLPRIRSTVVPGSQGLAQPAEGASAVR